MKKWYFTLAGLAVAGASLFAASSSSTPDAPERPTRPTREEIALKRAASPRKTAQQSPSRIKGGLSNDKQLYGFILGSSQYYYGEDFWDYDGPVAIKANGSHTKLTDKVYRAVAGCYFNGNLFIMNETVDDNRTVTYDVVNASTWESTNPFGYTCAAGAQLPNQFASDLTYNPIKKCIYGIFVPDGLKYATASKCSLGLFDPDNLDISVNTSHPWTGPTIIGEIDQMMRGIASNADGTLYGVGYDNVLYTIDPTTAELTKVVDLTFPVLPVTPYEDENGDPASPIAMNCIVESLECDWDTGDLYFSYADDFMDVYIGKINKSNGEIDLLYNSSYFSSGNSQVDALGAIYFMQEAAASGQIPAQTADVTVTPDGTSLSATVTFTMPSTDKEGSPLTGSLDWVISTGSTTLKSGSAQAGTSVTTKVTLAEAGLTSFRIEAKIGNNTSTPQMVTKFIGCDTPVIGSRPRTIANGMTISLSWKAAEAQNQGNMDAVTYKVVRQPDNKTITEGTSELRITDNVTDRYFQKYSYIVTPKAGNVAGEPFTSTESYAGEVFELPFSDDFTDEDLFNIYPVIDANNDSYMWWFNADRNAATYSATTREANDYLCIGPFDMIAGNEYTLYFEADGHSTVEKVAAYAGTDPDDASTFSTEVVEPTFCNPNVGQQNLTGHFTPATSGKYYFGIKACSNANTQNLYIFNVKVTGVTSPSPAAATELKLVPALESLQISCTLPALSLDGKNPAKLTAVNIYRDNTLIATASNGVADGAHFTFTDTDKVTDGTHTYRIAAVNAHGEGKPLAFEAYRGLDTPAAPTNIRVYDDINNPLLIHISWKSPAVGVHGGYVNPADFNWTVEYGNTGSINGSVTTGNKCETSFTLPAGSADIQDILACTVYASNPKGDSGRSGKQTNSTYFGPAKKLPLRESWANCTHKSGIWAGESIYDSDEIFEGLWDMSEGSAQDADGYKFALSTYIDNTGYRTRTPRITLEGTENPTLVFYYRYTADAKSFTLGVLEDDKPLRHIHEFDLNDGKAESWIRMEYPLSEFKKAKRLQFTFEGTAEKAAMFIAAIDNLSIIDLKDSDLSLISFTAPEKGEPNTPIALPATVRNSGRKAVAATDYKIIVSKNNEDVFSMSGVALEPDQELTLNTRVTPLITDGSSINLSARIEYAADQNTTDNSSSEATVLLRQPKFPHVDDLWGRSRAGVTLNWGNPDPNDMPSEQVTETFDTYSPFIIEDIGEWTLYDVDQANTVIMATALGILNYPNIGKPMAWQVIDPMQANIIDGAWYARSGEQMLVAFQASAAGERMVDSEDWLVSPELNGTAQEITFFARAGMRAYSPEFIDVLYSTTGKEMKDFKILAPDVEVPYANDWVEFSYNLPEGARYFAIVHKSFNKLAVLLDDISYAPAGSEPEEINLIGFNIYRDGKKLNNAPFTGTQYEDRTAEDGNDYSYQVTAVWDKGESVLSNMVTIKASSAIEGITDTEALINIYALQQAIAIDAPEGAQAAIYATSGACVAAFTTTGHDEIPVTPGIYIVRVGSKAAKLIVK